MFNLYEIIRNAHGGHALDNLGGRGESDGSEATALGRSGPGRRRARGPWRYFGVHLANTYEPPGSCPRNWPADGTRRPQRKPASAGFRCGFDPGGPRSPHQNTAAGNARGINAEIDQIMGGKRP
jgi:hypothetical protein